jgi:hypothetical protein
MCRVSVPHGSDWPLIIPTNNKLCWEPSIDLVRLLRWSRYKYRGVAGKDPYLGLEDARGLSVGGELYLMGSVNVFPQRGGPFLARIVLARMDATLRTVTSTVVLFPSYGDECEDSSTVAQKNWSVSPFRPCA